MSDHYYSNKPQSIKKTESNTIKIKDYHFIFTTSTGVFSKKGLDYGSRLLIESFQPPNICGDFLDLGCGYGPIGLTLAKDHPSRLVTMVDINERAIELSVENARQNHISNVEIKVSDGFQYVPQKKYAAIITNPPIRAGKKVIYKWFKDSVGYLMDKGELWIVVQKKQGAPSMKSFLSELFPEVTVISRQKGYYVFRATKGKN